MFLTSVLEWLQVFTVGGVVGGFVAGGLVVGGLVAGGLVAEVVSLAGAVALLSEVGCSVPVSAPVVLLSPVVSAGAVSVSFSVSFTVSETVPEVSVPSLKLSLFPLQAVRVTSRASASKQDAIFFIVVFPNFHHS